MNKVREATTKQDACMNIVQKTAVDELRDPDAIAEVLKETSAVIFPPFADWRAVAAEEQQIKQNSRRSDLGRAEDMAEWTEKSTEWGLKYARSIAEALAQKQAERAREEDAADRGLEPRGNGFVARDHVPTDPVQIALDGEARSEMRKLTKSAFSEKYRRWVDADHRLARVAEQDPMGELVAPELREWARRYRIERSPLAGRIKVMLAQERAFALALEWIQMGYGVRISENVNA